MDCSLPGSSVHGIFQTIVLEWIAISFSRGYSWPRDRTQVSRILDRCFTVWATRESKDAKTNLNGLPMAKGGAIGHQQILIAAMDWKIKYILNVIINFRIHWSYLDTYSNVSLGKLVSKRTKSNKLNLLTKLYLGMPNSWWEEDFLYRSILTNKWSGSNRILIL